MVMALSIRWRICGGIKAKSDLIKEKEEEKEKKEPESDNEL